jgi:hypothetical protein
MLPYSQQFRLAAVANRHRTNWSRDNALLEEVIADIKACYPDKFHTPYTLDQRQFAGVPFEIKYGKR